jgi:hypothetical protein
MQVRCLSKAQGWIYRRVHPHRHSPESPMEHAPLSLKLLIANSLQCCPSTRQRNTAGSTPVWTVLSLLFFCTQLLNLQHLPKNTLAGSTPQRSQWCKWTLDRFCPMTFQPAQSCWYKLIATFQFSLLKYSTFLEASISISSLTIPKPNVYILTLKLAPNPLGCPDYYSLQNFVRLGWSYMEDDPYYKFVITIPKCSNVQFQKNQKVFLGDEDCIPTL